MTNIRPGRGWHLTANKLLTHAAPHYQNGLVGIAQKQDEPKSFDSAESRKQIQSGVKYVLLGKGEAEVEALGGAVVGAPVFITIATDAITLTQGTGVTVPFGRVTALPGTFGLPAGRMRVDMDAKDDINTA